MKPPDRKTIHLFCNAHIDPAWLWEFEDGVAEAITTFRTAAELCEEFPEFIFNHNESLLYELVREHEPELFAKIQTLVKAGRWQITGGWYLQPDCNMPSGESLVRQMLVGKRFFRQHFGVEVTNGLNVDSFGHSRGLVQILKKAGYTGYFFGRPTPQACPFPKGPFRWIGYDGSEIIAIDGPSDGYSTRYGSLVPAFKGRLAKQPFADVDLYPWGVGDHGGGPSRIDLRDIRKFIRSQAGALDIRHSTIEGYLKHRLQKKPLLPEFRQDLNPFATGTYTSQIRIKQKHRELENTLYSAEKMATAAWMNGLGEYPGPEIGNALKDLLYNAFHDVMCGTCIQDAEDASLRRLEHGLEIVSRLRLRSFIALTAGQSRGQLEDIPVFFHNPHPYPIRGIFECQFMLQDFNWKGTFFDATVRQNGHPVPSQIELERADGALDWAKHVVIAATLEPGMNRFDCLMKENPKKSPIRLKQTPAGIRFRNGELEVFINGRTGLVDSYQVGGRQLVGKNAFRPLVMEDTLDPWGMNQLEYRKIVGRFSLMTAKAAGHFANLEGPLAPMRVIEDGPVRSVVEVLLAFGDSQVQMRYYLPKQGTAFRLDLRVQWNEKGRFLKLSVPLGFMADKFPGQVACGVENFPVNGKERVAQQWVAAASSSKNTTLTCINNGIYGSDCTPEELRLSLLRSPAFAGHPRQGRPTVMQDRFAPRIDQGERRFRFWFNGGPVSECLSNIAAEAQACNEGPYAQSFFPSGKGKKPLPPILLSDPAVQLQTLKKTEDGDGLVIRLFETTGRARQVALRLPLARKKVQIKMGAFELKTLVWRKKTRKLVETDLLERPTKKR